MLAIELVSRRRQLSHIVLSYARQDLYLAHLLHSRLIERGYSVWVDWEQVPSSDSWEQAVFWAIDSALALCVVLTPDSLKSRNCRLELSYALRLKKTIRLVVTSRLQRGG